MAKLTIDLQPGDAAEAKGTPVPEGTYDAEIDNVELVQAKSEKNAGKPMYKVRTKILDPEHSGRVLTTSVCLWYEARFSLQQLMTSLGFDIEGNKIEVPDERELIGKKVGIKVTHGEYNGRITANIDRFVPLSGSPVASAAAAVPKKKVAFGKKTA